MNSMEKEWFIQVPWGKIGIVAWGDCHNPPILLCHGLLDSAVSFRPLVSQLPKNYYYIGVELPGNGVSDNFPPGLMISVYDLAYSVKAVVKHFRWKNFIFIGHSMGAILGKMYNVCYPGDISKLVEIDPVNFIAVPPEDFQGWYKYFFAEFFNNYHKYNMPKEESPKLKWEEALASMRQNRPLLTEEQAVAVLERLSEPAGDGLIRYTFDRRNRKISVSPFSAEHIKTIFTATKNPILTIVFENSVRNQLFRSTKFLLDKTNYPNNNYRCLSVEGGHDAHISNPERIAPFIEAFMLKGIDGIDVKAKL